MKTLIISLLLTFTANVWAGDTVVVLSPYQDSASAATQVANTKSIFKKLPLGSTLTVIKGDGRIIATLKVPESKAYDHPKARMRLRRKELRPLNNFVNVVNQDGRTPMAMDVPRVLRQVANDYPNVSDIVLLGVSALFDEPSQTGLNMTYGHIPSDGFLNATASESAFGVKGREKLLHGKRVHWQLPIGASKDGIHFDALTRFYHLFVHHTGGELVSFSPNSAAAIDLLLDNAAALPMNYTLDTTNTKLEMLSTRKFVEEISAKVEQPIRQNESEDEGALAEKLNVMIMSIEWEDKDVDLDIHVTPKGGETLYYGRAVTELGRFYKDIRSGQGDKHHEYIAFERAVETQTLAISVKVFSKPDEVRDIRGTLHLTLKHKTYFQPFHFKFSDGKGLVTDPARVKNFTIPQIINNVNGVTL